MRSPGLESELGGLEEFAMDQGAEETDSAPDSQEFSQPEDQSAPADEGSAVDEQVAAEEETRFVEEPAEREIKIQRQRDSFSFEDDDKSREIKTFLDKSRPKQDED